MSLAREVDGRAKRKTANATSEHFADGMGIFEKVTKRNLRVT